MRSRSGSRACARNARIDAELEKSPLEHVEASAALPLLDVTWLDRCPLLAPLRGGPRFAKARAIVTARIEDMWS